MGHWARGDRELTTTVDKLRVVRGPVPEDRLAPRVQVNLDELEEDLNDYREYIRAEAEGAGGPLTPEEFQGEATGAEGPPEEPGEGVPTEDGGGLEVPEGELPEEEGGAAGQRMGAAAGGADPLEGGVPREAEAATEPQREEEPVPGLSGLGQMRGLTPRREAPRSPTPDSEGDICMEPEPRGLRPREPSGGHCWPMRC